METMQEKLEAILTRKKGDPLLITKSEAARAAEMLSESNFVTFPRLGLTINSYEIVEIESRKAKICAECSAEFFADGMHYCERSSIDAMMETPNDYAGEKHPFRVRAILSRPNPPKGDLDFIAHNETQTNLKAHPGKTYLANSPAKEKLRNQMRLIQKGVNGKEAYAQAWGQQL